MSQQQAHEKAEQIKTLQMIINKMQIKNKNQISIKMKTFQDRTYKREKERNANQNV